MSPAEPNLPSQQPNATPWRLRPGILEDLLAMSSAVDQIESTCGPISDLTARLLSAHIAHTLATAPASNPATATHLKDLSSLSRAISSIRRLDHDAARLRMEQQAFELARRECTTRREHNITPSSRPVPHKSLPLRRGNQAKSR